MPQLSNDTAALPPGAVINRLYRVERVLGHAGGFGITYLANDQQLNTLVAVKEFFPPGHVRRARGQISLTPRSLEDRERFNYGLEQFVREGRQLAQLQHPNVVRVRTVFEAHSTAYLVMDYHEGRTYASYLKHIGGRIGPALAVEIALRVLDAVYYVHSRRILHGDIKPENIYLTVAGQPLLFDFGAARQALAERTDSLTTILTPGFAPPEQYGGFGQQGPTVDIYSCAAVLYASVTGVTPTPATDRIGRDTLRPPHHLAPSVPRQISQAIMRGLAMEPSQRPQSAREFQDLLDPPGEAAGRLQVVARTETDDSLAGARRLEVHTGPAALTQPRSWRRYWARVIDTLSSAFR